ncbi:MAG TPA: cation transporter [Longimicrobiales bacterium]
MAIATLKVQGMSCDHCVRAVADALKRVDGVRIARVDLEAGRATVDYDDARTNPKELVGAVMDEGYTAEELP